APLATRTAQVSRTRSRSPGYLSEGTILMSIVYREEDGNLDYLAGKQIGVIGYGNLGRPIALNLRDSGVDVVVSESDETRCNLARTEGFTLIPTPELVRQADVIMLLVPDEVMPQLYLEQISPH